MLSMWIFKDRVEAGQKLGEALLKHNYQHPLILGLPRGGVIVAREVAQILHAPLDVVVARKIGAPKQEEYGIGALSEDEIPLFHPAAVRNYDVESQDVFEIVFRERDELRRRVELYRWGRPLPEVKGKTVIVIDDGLAMGVTAAAAGKYLRSQEPKQLILAVPVGPQEFTELVREPFDEIICLHQPSNYFGVGYWYDDFSQVEDHEVLDALTQRPKLPVNKEQ